MFKKLKNNKHSKKAVQKKATKQGNMQCSAYATCCAIQESSESIINAKFDNCEHLIAQTSLYTLHAYYDKLRARQNKIEECLTNMKKKT